MSCELTQGYTVDCFDNNGGVKVLYFMEFANATTITNTNGLITALTKATAKFFRKYELVKHTADVSEQLTFSRENETKVVKQTIKFPINKQSVAVRDELLLLASNSCLIVALDNNGNYWLYGKENGLTVTTIDAKSGVKLGDRNGYELVFEGEEKAFAYKLNDAIAAALETPGT